DSLTIAMFGMVTLAAAIIHFFSISSMRENPRFSRHFAAMGLLTFATLGLVLSATILQVLFFCELIGIASFLALGLWRGPASTRVSRAIVAQAIGAGLFVGIGLLVHDLGNVALPTLWAVMGKAAGGYSVTPSDGAMIPTSRLTLIGILLFAGVGAMAAQFPLQFWLPRTTTFSSPAGALICSAGPTAAGVYLLARMYPILTPDVRLLIAIIGVVTLTMGGLIALAQNDIRRLLAWCVVSQFGYIILAVGIGSWVGAVFHLMTQGFVITLLVLAATSVGAAMNRRHNLSAMGGLWKKLPVTAAIFAVGALALAGAPFFSGYYSRLMIGSDAAAYSIYATHTGQRAGAYWMVFILPTAIAYLIAFAIMRCWMLAFAGTSRSPAAFEQAREHAGQWAPLLAIAVPSIIAGYAMNIPELLRSSIAETNVICNEILQPAARFTAFDETWPAVRPPPVEFDIDESTAPAISVSPAAEAHEHGRTLARKWLTWGWIVGMALAIAIYWKADGAPRRFLGFAPFRWINEWLSSAMYFEELYDWTIGRPLRAVVKFYSR
ncbi:MAG TPA: proton-conducting transporter membrane subunit, partial [Humisphaera sp.]|nr:proton-conducting transporter membrane subunit [Humisphaera sp.]